MSRRLVGGLSVLAALALPGAAGASLVLSPREAPGLKQKRASVAAGRKAVGAALRPARPPAPRGRGEASHFARAGTELWSLAYVLPNGKAAARQLHGLVHAVRHARRARVGNEGYTVATRRAVVVVWRRRNAVGEILLTSGRPPPRRVALAYAGVVDARMDHLLGLDAWHRTLEQIRPDGTVPRKTALGLFALAYAPLPGTKAPPGPAGTVEEGTLAAGLILGLLPTLTPAQQAFALRALGLGAAAPARLPRKVTAAPACGDSTFLPNAGLQTIADKYAEIYSASTRLGNRLTLKIVVGTTAEAISSEGEPKALADAIALDDQCKVTNAAKLCRIRVTRHGQNQPADALEFVLAHEVFHCFQDSIMTPEVALDKNNRRLWLIEGMADWAALTVKPLPYGVLDEYGRYLETPEKPLFERVYDAAGFFGHLEDSTGDLWPRIPGILQQLTSPGNVSAAGADTSTFLNSWSASTYNEPDLGFDWTMTLPLLIPKDVMPSTVPIFQDTSVKAEPYTFARFEIDPDFVPANLPLLHLEIAGSARLKNDSIDTTILNDAYFCLREKCECPKGEEGTPPPAPPLGEDATNLALSAAHVQTAGDVTFESLAEYCKHKQKPPPPPEGGGGGGGGGGGCGGCGGSNGDPHLHTFDDRYYDFMAAGEFVLARSRADGLELQARQEPYPGRNYVSINTAFAMRVAGDRVAVYRGDPLVVRVNGRGFLVGRKPARLPHGGTIRLVFDQVFVKWPDGTLARVLPVQPWGINVLLRPALSLRGTFTGLLGNFNGTRADDWATRQGRKITLKQLFGPNGFHLLYRVLGDSWRVTQRESLFDYGRGQSTRTFTIRNFPHNPPSTAALGARLRRAALRACRRLHIKNPQILADCTLDVGATGDNRFATGAREYERTAGKFGVVRRGGTPPPAGGPETRWTPISKGGSSNIVYASLQPDGGKVVAAYLLRSGVAEAATFTPSVGADATGVRRDVITSGWGFLGNPFLVPRAGGGLQVLLSGIHSNNNGDPLNGTSLAPRNPDGSFGAPVPASTSDRAEVDGPGVLAPDGQPLWASAWHGGLYLARGATGTVIADLTPVAASLGVSAPAVGRDGQGRYWLAWRSLGPKPPLTGIYLLRIDPGTLQPVGSPQLAPSSGSVVNATVVLHLACGKTCRVVYLAAPDRLVSWAYGERRSTVVAALHRAAFGPGSAAAYTADGRLWAVWWNDTVLRFEAKLGDAAGAGGKPIPLARPPGTSLFAGALSALTAGNELVVVENWGAGGTFSRYVNVVAPR